MAGTSPQTQPAGGMMSKSLSLEVILSARDKVTGHLKTITGSSKSAAAELKKAQQEVRQLQASQRDVSSFKRMGSAIRENSAQLAAAQERARQLGKELKSTANPTDKLRGEFNKARKEVEQLTAKGQAQRKELGAVRKRLKEAGVDVRSLADGEKLLADRMQAANDRIQRQKTFLEQLNKADVAGKFKNMTNEVAQFGKRAIIATTGVAAGIFGIANSTATLGDNAAKTADKLGLSIETLQELRYAGERSGIGANTIDMAMQRMVRRLAEAAKGSGEAKGALEELGMDAQ